MKVLESDNFILARFGVVLIDCLNHSVHNNRYTNLIFKLIFKLKNKLYAKQKELILE